jgi:hypothetical protein
VSDRLERPAELVALTVETQRDRRHLVAEDDVGVVVDELGEDANVGARGGP